MLLLWKRKGRTTKTKGEQKKRKIINRKKDVFVFCFLFFICSFFDFFFVTGQPKGKLNASKKDKEALSQTTSPQNKQTTPNIQSSLWNYPFEGDLHHHGHSPSPKKKTQRKKLKKTTITHSKEKEEKKTHSSFLHLSKLPLSNSLHILSNLSHSRLPQLRILGKQIPLSTLPNQSRLSKVLVVDRDNFNFGTVVNHIFNTVGEGVCSLNGLFSATIFLESSSGGVVVNADGDGRDRHDEASFV